MYVVQAELRNNAFCVQDKYLIQQVIYTRYRNGLNAISITLGSEVFMLEWAHN